MLDVQQLRAEFPTLLRSISGRPIVYLDNAATALKPRVMIDAISSYYSTNGANIHRGLHALSQEATESFESVRARIAVFLGASSDDEIVFTRGTTESLNIVAAGLSLQPGDNVVGTIMDHHSNVLPWQSRCEFRAADVVRNAPSELAAMVSALVDDRTRAVVAPMYSNVTGQRLPVEALVDIARRRGIPLVVDAAQAGGHVPLDVAAVGADFIALSGHKMCGPTGVGVLYGAREWLARLAPVFVGGGTIATLDLDAPQPVVFRRPPWRFEAGTPDIASVIGMGATVRFLESAGMQEIHDHVMSVLGAGLEAIRAERLEELFEVRTGAPADNVGIIAFAPRRRQLDPVRLSQILSDTYGVMARAGSHCAHPLHKALGWGLGSLRFSLQLYNTVDEIVHAVGSLAAAARAMRGQG